MLTPQFILPLSRELVIDLFAGGGGASTGIEHAVGRHVDIAVNHDREAVALHQANHPQTRHYVEDVFAVDPREVTEGRPVGLLWASPDCKHFSKAKGGKPVSKKIRGLAWVMVKGEPYAIVDIGMRMLTPRELYRAQGFPESYIIDWGTDPFTGARITLTKTAQVRMCGNSVCPPVAAALVRANYSEQAVLAEAA